MNQVTSLYYFINKCCAYSILLIILCGAFRMCYKFSKMNTYLQNIHEDYHHLQHMKFSEAFSLKMHTRSPWPHTEGPTIWMCPLTLCQQCCFFDILNNKLANLSSQLTLKTHKTLETISPVKIDMPNLVFILIRHLYLSGMWSDMAPKTNTKKTSTWRIYFSAVLHRLSQSVHMTTWNYAVQ